MNPTERFSDRASYYARWRPGYPPEVADFLRKLLGSTGDIAIADIGSGTGLLTEQLLKIGNPVYAVEPNREMRTAAELALNSNAAFRSIAATAEATTLKDRTIDLVTAGQAFHWFDHARARAEFARILRSGWVALVWNERKTGDQSFNAAYEAFLKEFRSTERTHKSSSSEMAAFFAPHPMQIAGFDNHQSLDLAGLTGRVLSSSDMPLPDHPKFSAMSDALHHLFDKHQTNGAVRIEYDSRVYYGRIA